MSASLVGSGDVYKRQACHVRLSHRPCVTITKNCTPTSGVRSSSTPAPKSVSYTHLTLPTICSV
eukprot:271918-Alexandrium_andersonii.AAC.1